MWNFISHKCSFYVVYFSGLKYPLTSHSTHNRSFRGRFLQARWPNQQRQSTEGKLVGRQRSGLNPTRTTPPCYNNTTLGNRLYTQRKSPNVTNPICLTCKNCSDKCAADCEHCVTQSRTELFWQYSLLTSRHLVQRCASIVFILHGCYGRPYI